jgi:hypothetical protein
MIILKMESVMKTHTVRTLCLALSASAILAACASSSTQPKNSGFLQDYTVLHKDDAPGGGSRMVYRNPEFTPARYRAIWLEPLQYFPEPQATDQVSMATLTELRNYGDRALRQKLGSKFILVNGPGPGVAHWRIAVTAVGTQTEALKAYQYIPIGLVITGAMAAVQGGRPQDASVAIENKVTDSETNVLLFASVRGGTGERVQSTSQGQAGVRADDLKPLIDQWTDAAAGEIGRYVQPR